MKLTMAMAAALVLCGGSLVARASIVHHRALELDTAQRAWAAEHTQVKESERLAMSGVDLRLGSRLHRLAQRAPRVR